LAAAALAAGRERRCGRDAQWMAIEAPLAEELARL
jgi:hypothetical protein